jgi:hypothetical protein
MKRRSSNGSRLQRALDRPYWGAEEAEAVLEAWRESGQSMAAFARERGLVRGRLARWQRRLKTRSRDSQAIAFHPVRVVLPPHGGPEAKPAIELVLSGGRRVAVHRGFDAVVLEELVRVVESWPC